MRVQDRGRAYEDRVAKERNMAKQPFSGAGVWKEDLVGDWEVVQCKSTGNDKVFQLLREDLVNVVMHGVRTGKLGVLFLEFDREEYVVMRRKDYESYVVFEPVQNCHLCFEEMDIKLTCKECYGKSEQLPVVEGDRKS